MTSTEFTIGLSEGCRVSSKVLKPPGGGSSNIFGLENSYATGKSSSEKNSKNEDSSTHSRVFGAPDCSPHPKNAKKNNSENGNTFTPQPKQAKKHVRRNPITGEEIEVPLEAESDDKIYCDNERQTGEESSNVRTKPVPSIRVRNPPGGKSSGIF